MTKFEIESKVLEIIAYRENIGATSKLYSDFGLMLIDADILTENSQILAGLQSSDLSEAEEYFFKTLKDLRVNIPEEKSEILLAYSRIVSQKVILSELSPFEGARQMYGILIDSDYDPIYMEFLTIDEAVELLGSSYSPIAGFNIDPKGYVIEAFKYFLWIIDHIPEKHLDGIFVCENCNFAGIPEKFYKWKVLSRENSLRCMKCKSENIIDCFYNEGKRRYLSIVGDNCG